MMKAPWTTQQVEELNYLQQCGMVHPYTCANRSDARHTDGEGVLVATENGWICPYCDYKQNWCGDIDGVVEGVKQMKAWFDKLDTRQLPWWRRLWKRITE